ncbi:unknown protein [Seminavis robusta]|uniref:VWFD domain-containing protein n=1 Tax=Seminavis robusta TaxID=568900 RepID=A0A9N8EKB3_9STRA|nr:unknown protein [Seminavis robusta]|eukprot:Sro1288_g259630.1 n/a (251) ;mRNA; r:28043-28795
MNGDPHCMTWNGTWYDYHGVCDLVLIHAPDLDMRVHVRTKARNDYSYIETAALSIGDDVLEVSSWGDFALNDVDHALLIHHGDKKGVSTLSGYPIYHRQPFAKHHIFDVVLDPNENITISTFKDLVSVRISGGAAKHFGSSQGMMGSFDGVMLARDGSTVMSNPNAFGQEWQVHDDEPQLFVRAPHYPGKCIFPSQRGKKTEVGRACLRKTLAKSAAEDACSHLSGEKKDACVFDVLATGDADIARTSTY